MDDGISIVSGTDNRFNCRELAVDSCNLTSRHSLPRQGIYRHRLNGGYVPEAAVHFN
ncbi:hypothetical protein [Thalassotalea litorea]|uniref:hypothetical protein n=1 Tax=Thalassotalea litorea TaxID=2020715 RepID=UPI003736381B